MGGAFSSDNLYVCGRESLTCGSKYEETQIVEEKKIVIPTVKQITEVSLDDYQKQRREQPLGSVPVIQDRMNLGSVPLDLIGFPLSPNQYRAKRENEVFDDIIGYALRHENQMPDCARPVDMNDHIFRMLHDAEMNEYLRNELPIHSSSDRNAHLRSEMPMSACNAYPRNELPIRVCRDIELDEDGLPPSSYYSRNIPVCRAAPLEGNDTMHNEDQFSKISTCSSGNPTSQCSYDKCCNGTEQNINSYSMFPNNVPRHYTPEEYAKSLKNARKRLRRQRKRNAKKIVEPQTPASSPKQNHVSLQTIECLDANTDPRVEELIRKESDRIDFRRNTELLRKMCGHNPVVYNNAYNEMLTYFSSLSSKDQVTVEDLDRELDEYMAKDPRFKSLKLE